MAIGVVGFGCEDALAHLLNSVWPNIFETSPHVVNAFTEAVEGLRVGCGSVKVLQYALQVGFNNLFPNQFYSPGVQFWLFLLPPYIGIKVFCFLRARYFLMYALMCFLLPLSLFVLQHGRSNRFNSTVLH